MSWVQRKWRVKRRRIVGSVKVCYMEKRHQSTRQGLQFHLLRDKAIGTVLMFSTEKIRFLLKSSPRCSKNVGLFRFLVFTYRNFGNQFWEFGQVEVFTFIIQSNRKNRQQYVRGHASFMRENNFSRFGLFQVQIFPLAHLQLRAICPRLLIRRHISLIYCLIYLQRLFGSIDLHFST